MLAYNQSPKDSVEFLGQKIESFIEGDDLSLDLKTVESFGKEWEKFNSFKAEDLASSAAEYFDVWSKADIPKNASLIDVGCGTGRWSRHVADRVGFIEAIDPSNALFSAVKYNEDIQNIRFTKASVGNIPFADGSFDIAMCLGVLHHTPDTQYGIDRIYEKLKKDGWLLLYLYYSLDSRGLVYKTIFNVSTTIRKVVSSLPDFLKLPICDLIAILIYLPLVSIVKIVHAIGLRKLASKLPLHYYMNKNFRIMRNDALDRFGTPLENRFSKAQIKLMLERSGFTKIIFSDNQPYWHVIAKK